MSKAPLGSPCGPGLPFLKGSQSSRLCPLIHCVHSCGVAFGNLSPFGRLWSILLNSGLIDEGVLSNLILEPNLGYKFVTTLELSQ